MKKSKFSEEQIARALRQVEGGNPPADVCRQLRHSDSEMPSAGQAGFYSVNIRRLTGPDTAQVHPTSLSTCVIREGSAR